MLDILQIEGCIVPVDAEGCQTYIAAGIRKKGADYAFALKANQPNLHDDVEYFFSELAAEDLEEWVEYHETFDVSHGRYETREYFHIGKIGWLPRLKEFKDAKSIGVVKATREENCTRSITRRYYISSFPQGAEAFSHVVRTHWSTENTPHWTPDMSFREDGFATAYQILRRRLRDNASDRIEAGQA